MTATIDRPRDLTPPRRPGGAWLRIAIRCASLGVLLLVLVPLHYAGRALGRRTAFAPLFLKLAARVVGARVCVRGRMVGGAVLLVANHVSWLDILALGGASGTAFVAKDDLENTPLVGWLCRMNRTVFIPRHNRRGVRKQVERVRTALSEPGRVTIFPEGTTGDGETLLPFKPAMFAALLPPPAGLTVQPVFIDYGELSPWIGWTGEEGGVANFLKVLGRRGSFPLELHFLEPFNPQDFADRKEIAAVARSAIAEKVAATGKGQAH